MSKINEIKDKHASISWKDNSYKWVEEAMKEYAEIFARKSLKKASEEVVVDYDITNHTLQEIFNNEIAKQGFDDDIKVYALKHSITDIELPNHN